MTLVTRIYIQSRRALTVALLTLAVQSTLGRAANAETYRLIEFYTSEAVIRNGSADAGWSPGRNELIRSLAQDLEREHNITIGRGRIRIGNNLYVQRDVQPAEVLVLLGHLAGPPGSIDQNSFPLKSNISGPLAKAALKNRPDFADAHLFLAASDDPASDTAFLVPVGDQIIRVTITTIWSIQPLLGQSYITISLFQPVGEGLEFTEAEVAPDRLEKGLEFTEEEALATLGKDEGDKEKGFVFEEKDVREEEGYSFSDEEILRELERENEDNLRLLACAAGLAPCPDNLDPELVLIHIRTSEDPVADLQAVLQGRREDRQRQ